jgi:hypothetical protein|eukprot:COSAG02_NODE_4974_length_4768_cov_5.889698_2_plen_173_part_00
MFVRVRPRLQRYQGRGRKSTGADQSSAPDLGNVWPTATMTLEYNRADLAAHQEEFDRQMAFAFTVYSVEDIGLCVGCVYIDPSPKVNHDAAVTLWMRDSHDHLDGELYTAVKTWVLATESWSGAGWKSVAWPGRVQSFDEWDGEEDVPTAEYAQTRLEHFGGRVQSAFGSRL